MKKVLCVLSLAVLTGCSGNSSLAWWGAEKAKPVAKVASKPKTDDTQVWLDRYEPRLKAAIEGSDLVLTRERNVLVVTMPVKGSFNPDRPQLLMPAKLGPLTRLAKIAEQDAEAAVLVLGHADSSGALEQNRTLSQQRAAAVASIFRLSGLQRDRMMLKGVGPDMPRAANDSAAGRELNRRVDIILTPKHTLVAILEKYGAPAKPSLAPGQAEASASR